jgi:ferric-dicitrate binding protein FerR (iron transport regulator)
MDRLLKKYLNGTCTPDEYAKVLEMIRDDENNQSLDRFMNDNWEAIEAKSDETTNDNLLGRIHHQIALNESNTTQKSIRFYRLSLQIAAALIVGLIVTSAYIFNYNHSLQSLTQHVSTSPGSITNFKLPDGSEVWLNSGSEITYAGNFEKDRKLQLKGEAFFDVVKSGSTFKISTEYGNIQVLGTAFNVKAYSNDSFITTLERGSLEVSIASGKDKQMLKPGDQASLTESNQLLVKPVSVDEFISWKDGKLMFVRKSLGEVTKMLERWYNVKIELESTETKELWFTGTIEKETISEVLELIKTTIPIEYSFNSKTRIMKIKAK